MSEYKFVGSIVIAPDGGPVCQVDRTLREKFVADTNGMLIADAFNVAEKAGKTPSQIFDLLKEAHSKLVIADQHIKHSESGLHNPLRDQTIKKVGDVISHSEGRS